LPSIQLSPSLKQWLEEWQYEILLGIIGVFSWVAYFQSIHLPIDYLRMPKFLWAISITLYCLIIISINVVVPLIIHFKIKYSIFSKGKANS
jgi:integral membrane sensor domain MASE1